MPSRGRGSVDFELQQSIMALTCSGALEIVKGCHSKVAIAGMLTKM